MRANRITLAKLKRRQLTGLSRRSHRSRRGPKPGNQTVIVVPSNLVNVRPLKRSLKR